MLIVMLVILMVVVILTVWVFEGNDTEEVTEKKNDSCVLLVFVDGEVFIEDHDEVVRALVIWASGKESMTETTV